MKLTLTEKRPETENTTSFILKPETPLAWKAGQFLHYVLPHENADDRKTERYFTISSAPFESNVMITTRRAEKGSSFKKALFDLPIGATIEADGLDGDFVIDDPDAEFIFIAGGVGITPFHSILLDLDHRGVSIKAKLLYSNRDENFIFKREFEALAAKHRDFTIRYFVNPERIDEAAIRKEAPDLAKPIFYVSGPEPMTEAFEKMMLGMGIPDEHLKRDYFPGYDWP